MKTRQEQPRFSSLWKVVCDATAPTENRHRLYEEARDSMLEFGYWRNYELVLRFKPGRPLPKHLGYRRTT